MAFNINAMDKAKDKTKAHNQPQSDKAKNDAPRTDNITGVKTPSPTFEPQPGKYLITMLPTDLLGVILDCISFPHDFGSLRGTCKALEPWASARLFRDTTADLTTRLPRKTYHGNKHDFHQYIRHLKFKPAPRKPYEWTEQIRSKYRSIIHITLRAVPPNVLSGIRTPALLPLDAEIMYLLVSKQKKLFEICLGPLDGSYLAAKARLHRESKLAAQEKQAARSQVTAQSQNAAEPKPKPWPSALQTLEITGSIGGEQDFRSCSEIIRNSQNLEGLVIRYRADTIRASGLSLQAQDNATSYGRISKMLSIPNVTTKDDPNFKLSRLEFQHVDVYYARRTFTKYIQFDELSNLGLSNCSGAENCLTTLTTLFSSGAGGSSLRTFSLLVGRNDEVQPRRFNSEILFGFLKCLKQLKDLNLDLWSVTARLNLRCLGPHARSLQKLYISLRSHRRSLCRYPNYTAMRLDDLQYLCDTFTKLKQLAITLSSSDLLMYFSRNLAEYQSYLRALTSLPNLEILRIINWPLVLTDYFIKVDREMWLITEDFNKRMERFAKMAVKQLTRVDRTRNSQLKLLIFGGNSSRCIVTELRSVWPANARCYLIDTPSRNSTGAVLQQVSAKSVKYHRPDCSNWHRPVDEFMEEAEVEWSVVTKPSGYRGWTLDQILEF